MTSSPKIIPSPQASKLRDPNLGRIERLSNKFPKEKTLSFWKKTASNRAFEFETARVYNTGIIKMPIYLSVGQEHISAAISEIAKDPLIFAQHRGHSYYMSFGGDLRKLIDELLHRPTGCAGGMGGSASIHEPTIGMYGHSGLMGDQVPIAVGAALGSGKTVLTVTGDASVEEDYVWGAMGYAATKKLPVLLICEDNDLSILTPVATRRNWNVVNFAKGLGIPAVDIADDPWLIAHWVKNFLPQLPAVINVRTVRNLWHAGTGNDGTPEWDRYALIKEEFKNLGLEKEMLQIELEAQETVKRLWQEQLQKPSKK